jgi:hypothetical protein
MSVQVNNGKVANEHNGLEAIVGKLLDFTDADRVVAVVTYKVSKKTTDMETGEDYPVVKVTHIEPMLSADALETAKQLQASEYQVRTGEDTLDVFPQLSVDDTEVSAEDVEETLADAFRDPFGGDAA